MTVPATPRRAGPFNGNGVTTSFPFTFKVFSDEDLLVVFADTGGVESTLVLDTDYSVALNPDQDSSPGGTITYPISGDPLATGETLSAVGNLDYDQPLDLPGGGNFNPVAIENQLDRTAMQIQQLAEQVVRAVKVPVTDDGTGELSGDLAQGILRLADSVNNIDTVAGGIANVNAVAGGIANVQTVADNVADVTNFSDVYYGPSASDPALRKDGSALQGGDLYFNTVTKRLRVFDGSAWVEGPVNAGTYVVDRFSGTGAQTAFTLSTEPLSENNTQVYIAGIYQQKDRYSLSGTTLTFSSAPPLGTDNIEAVTIVTMALGESDAALARYTPAGTDAVATTVQNKLREFVSVTDFGAVGDGVADDTSKIQAAVTAVGAAGGGIAYVPQGTYKITAPIALPSNVTLRGAGKQNTTLTEGALTFVLQAQGSLAGTSHNLASNAAKDGRTIVLAAGGGASYQVGDYALLQAENLPFAGALAVQKQAEFVRIEAVVGDTITVRGGLAFSYTTADTAKLTKLNPVAGFAVEDLRITSQDPASYSRIFADFEYCADFAIRRCDFQNGKSTAVYLLGCINAEIDSCTGRDLQSDPVVPGAFGYFVCEAGPNLNLNMHGCSTESVRHTYTTATGGGTATVQPYGFPMFSKVSNCKSLWPFAAGFDTHPGAGFGIEFDNCSVFKGNQFGFQIRSEDTLVKSCFVYGAIGPAVSVTNYGNNSYITDVHAEDVCVGTDASAVSWTSAGAFSDNSQNTVWNNVLAKNSGGPAFEQVRGGGGCEVIGLRAINPCRIDATVKSGIVITGTSGGSVLIDNPIITCGDARMDYGILSASASPQLLVSGDYITGSQVARYSVANTLSFFLNSKRSRAINTYGRGEAVTIAAGVLSVANIGSGYLVVDGEGSMADDLVTINGGLDGDVIVLRKSSPTITVKHGTGNIQLTGNVDHSLLNTYSILTLMCIGAVWVEVARRT